MLLKLIQEAESVFIYRHSHPDCDALGSQFGLKQWINDNYPEKHVYAIGSESSDQFDFPALDHEPEGKTGKTLSVVLDTGNSERIDGEGWNRKEQSLKIDHHPPVENYADHNMVHTAAAATAEILCELFIKLEGECRVSEKTATYLYAGLLTDTLCFRTSNTTSNTLSCAAYLAAKKISIPEINRRLFDQSLNDYQFASKIRQKLNTEAKTGWVVLTRDVLQKYAKTASEARNFIDEIGHLTELEAWAFFTETENGFYDGSLRSKHIRINDIASEYNGGGHPNAAGVKKLTFDDVQSIIKKIQSRINES